MIGFYLRRSRADRAGDDENRIEKQRLIVTDYANKRYPGVKTKEYIDIGHTGMDFDRDAWKQMIEDCKAGVIDTVIAKDRSRLGRDYTELNDYLELIFPMLNIHVITVLDGYESERDYVEGEGLNIFVKASNVMSTFYVKDIAMKQMSALRAKWKRGMLTSRMTPYGYYCEDIHKGWIVDDEAAGVVRRIFREKAEGKTNAKIAGGLNADHIETPGQRQITLGIFDEEKRNADFPVDKQVWTGTMVGRVLREEAYTGVLIQGKMVCYNPGRKMNRKTDPDEWFRHEGHHEALVDRDAWEKVQKNPRDKPEKGAGSVMRLSAKRMEAVDDHFFRGILRCGNCGCLMAHCSSTSYRCVKAGQRQYAGCSEKMFKEDELKEQTWAEIQRLQLAARERLDSSPGFDRETISELEDKVEGLTELRLQKYNELLSGKIEQPEFVIVRDVIGEKLEMAETELGRLKALATDRERMEKALEPLVALEELTGDGLRTAAEAVFVDDEGVRVKLKAREFLN